MSAERPISSQQTARGGCLDSLVTAATFGRFGVETTVTVCEPIRPTFIPPGALKGASFPVERYSVTELALKTGKTVIVHDFGEANKPQIARRIVRLTPQS